MLPSGSLPEEYSDGYFTNSAQEVVILTRHLSYIGLKSDQALLTLAAPTSKIHLGSVTQLKLEGGSGSGLTDLLSLTPDICQVTNEGLLTALVLGSCSVVGWRIGDRLHLNATSNNLQSTVVVAPAVLPVAIPMVIKQTGKSITYGTISGIAILKLALTTKYACKKVVLQVRRTGTQNFLTRGTLRLNKAGTFATRVSLPDKSMIRIRYFGKTIASLQFK